MHPAELPGCPAARQPHLELVTPKHPATIYQVTVPEPVTDVR
jgi:hypothetical protein